MEVSLSYSIQREDLDRKKLDRKIIPKDLDILLATLHMYDFHVRFSSKTPRNTVSLTCVMGFSLRTT